MGALRLTDSIGVKARFDLIHDELIGLRRDINRLAEDEKAPLPEVARALAEVHLDEAMIALRKAQLAMLVHGGLGRSRRGG